jgi:predicted dehydrogenase
VRATSPAVSYQLALCFCLGEFKEVSSVVATQRKQIRIVETGEMIPMTSPDQVLVSGVLESGATASVHVKGGTANGTSLMFEIHGSEGDIVIAPREPRAGSSVQISELTLARFTRRQTSGRSPDPRELSLGSTRRARRTSIQCRATLQAHG